MVHALITLAVAVLNWLLFGTTKAGDLMACIYIGREHAQAEYRYIEAHGGKREDCPWYCGFLPSAWTVKGMLDWMLPVIAANLRLRIVKGVRFSAAGNDCSSQALIRQAC